MIRRIAILVGLILGSSLAPAQAGWTAGSAPGAALGRAGTTNLEPVDGILTATCMVGGLGSGLNIQLSWTDTPQPWVDEPSVDGYEWRQRVGGNDYPVSGTFVPVVSPAPHTYTVDVPITTVGTYQFVVRSRARAWRSVVDRESPARTATKFLVLWGCS